MALRITVIPASTQAGKETIRSLLADDKKPFVNAIYRDVSKAPAEFTSHPHFSATKGDVTKDSSLDFSNSDAVFYIPPPTYDGTDSAEFATKNANSVKTALEQASSVKRLLIFSAIGAQYDKGIGILSINHLTDKILKDSAPEVVIAKSGYFQEIWAEAFETMQAEPPMFYSPMSPPDHKLAMVSICDIGKICAERLLETGKALPSNPHIFDIHGPRLYSTFDVQAALEVVTGKKPNIVSIEPDQLYSFFGEKVPSQYAEELAEMTAASLPGGSLAAEMEKKEGIVRGETELVDSLRKIAAGAMSKSASGVF